MQIRFEKTVDQPASGIALPCVDQNAADKLGAVCHHERRGIPTVIDSRDLIGMQAQRERSSRQQLAFVAINQDGLLRSHGD
jgi:hypothetical protein